MPLLKTQCPECAANLRLAVDGAGGYEVECPKCGHEFTASLGNDDTPPPKSAKRTKPTRRRDDDRPTRSTREKAADKSKAPLIIVAVAAGVFLVCGIVALAIALSGPKSQPVAQNDPPPPAPTPPATTPPVSDATPPPELVPAADVPAVPQPAGDVFARAAAFKPDGPLPELTPLPPVELRPILALDPGGHTAFVRDVFFTPDASRVISVSEDKSVRVWDVASGEVVQTIRLPAGPDVEGALNAAALSPDGKLLAVGGFPLGRGQSGIPFYVLSVETGELLSAVSGAKETIHALDFSPDGKRIAVGCGDGTLQVYDFPTAEWVYRVAAHTGYVKQVRFHPKRGVVATVGREGDVKTWDLKDTRNPASQNWLKELGPNTIDWTADGAALAVGFANGEVRLYDPAGKSVKTVAAALEKPDAPIQVARMRLLPDDKRVVFGGVSGPGWAGVTDIETGKQPALVKDHSNTVTAVNRSADGTLAVSAGGESNEIVVWKTADGTVVRKFQSASKSVWAVGWGKDGKSLAWGQTNRSGADRLHALERTFLFDEFLGSDPPRPERTAAASSRTARSRSGRRGSSGSPSCKTASRSTRTTPAPTGSTASPSCRARGSWSAGRSACTCSTPGPANGSAITAGTAG
jgi:predicted Zn finger-like uncharacterized protein